MEKREPKKGRPVVWWLVLGVAIGLGCAFARLIFRPETCGGEILVSLSAGAGVALIVAAVSRLRRR